MKFLKGKKICYYKKITSMITYFANVEGQLVLDIFTYVVHDRFPDTK